MSSARRGPRQAPRSASPASAAPLTRRERRAIAREERALRPRASGGREARPAAWRSPMVLLSIAALAIGLTVIGFAVLSRPGSSLADEVTAPLTSVPAGLADGRALGRADAPVTVEIWSDFQCPGCRQLAQLVEPPLIEEFVASGAARLVYRDAAFQGKRVGRPYDESVEPAAAARCAADQGRFWQMHDWLFANWDGENQGAFRAERLRAIAQGAGLELAAYDACMAVGDRQAAVRAETNEGVAAGVNATPTLFINGRAYVGGLSVPEVSTAIRAVAGEGRLRTAPSGNR